MSERTIKEDHIGPYTLGESDNTVGSTDEQPEIHWMESRSGDESSEVQEEECVTIYIKKEPHSCSPERSTSNALKEKDDVKEEDNNDEEIVQNITLPEFVHCNGSFPGTSSSSLHVKQEAITKKSTENQPVFHSIKRINNLNSSFSTRNLKFLAQPETWTKSAWIPPSPKVTRLVDETEEQYNERCMKLRLRYLKWLEKESPNQREERLKKMRDRGKRRRNKETEEERENRLQKLRLRQTQRLINETSEQKAHRLKQMRLRAAYRLANETPEQREIRLLKMRQNAARRLASETPEEREARLSMLRSYRSRNLAGKVRKLKRNCYTQLPSETSEVQDCGINLSHSNYLTQTESLERLQNSNCSLNDGAIEDSMYMSHSTSQTKQ